MRNLELGALILALMPCAAACSSEKAAPDIGYGASDGMGATGATNAATGGMGNTGNQSTSGGKGGKSPSNGGSETAPNGGTAGVAPDPSDCASAWSAPPAETDCDLDALPDSGLTIGTVTGNYRTVSADTTLESGKTYKLDGLTIVESGVTLTIQKCTKILGQSNSSVLIADSGVVDQGDGNWAGEPCGRIVAIGEADAPIVMTGSKPPGDRKPGDWGGLVLSGKAPQNTWSAMIEGQLPMPPVSEGILERRMVFGWRTEEFAAEDSGTLKYVRVEYAGHDLGEGSETNGITLNAVGSGTTISHVMVANALDDCFEWFGGTVNADHLIAYNCDDDAFDTDLGYSGKVQFGFARQYPVSLEADSNGFEMDGNKVNQSGAPQSRNSFSNMVMCGGHTGQFQNNPRFGAVLRVGTRASLLNTLITGFDTAALSVRDPGDSAPSLTFVTAFDNFALFDQADKATAQFVEQRGGDAAAWFNGQEANSTDAPAGFCDCWANPPQPFATSKIAGVAPGAGFPEPNADFRGAFKDSTPESNWMTGRWVDWAED